MLAALSLTAIFAVAAQAESGELLIEGKPATESEVEKEEVPITATSEKSKLAMPGVGLVMPAKKGKQRELPEIRRLVLVAIFM